MKKKNLTSNEEITKLYTDTYRSRMPLYNDYVFHRIYGSDTEESRAALIGLLNIILERKNDPMIWVTGYWIKRASWISKRKPIPASF